MVQTYDLVLGLVALGLEVEVVAERVLAALVRGGEHNGHVELAPALLVDAERRLLERCGACQYVGAACAVASHPLCLFLSKDGCRL